MEFIPEVAVNFRKGFELGKVERFGVATTQKMDSVFFDKAPNHRILTHSNIFKIYYQVMGKAQNERVRLGSGRFRKS